jgi:predicted nuclease of predicted toxin-antitoxin system
MKVLLDENLPHVLRKLLPGHEVFTVQFKQWDSIRNSALLQMAARDGFDVLLTMDAGFAHEQNLQALPIAVVLIGAQSNRPEVLSALAPKIIKALDELTPKTLSRVD